MAQDSGRFQAAYRAVYDAHQAELQGREQQLVSDREALHLAEKRISELEAVVLRLQATAHRLERDNTELRKRVAMYEAASAQGRRDSPSSPQPPPREQTKPRASKKLQEDRPVEVKEAAVEGSLSVLLHTQHSPSFSAY
eukprot:comp13743_c0_seq1/m.9429 comp13743_c0_seq1/g.9429  ORF comp13743_c0_seq1/g.9429 comp13743_c0_seq1/m.9429 type:complete len:139 (-) comp13743_c0_seq1:313-729(-)